MSPGYTINGDAWQNTPTGTWAIQTFRPKRDFILHYVDIWFKRLEWYSTPMVNIYWADSEHQPFGDRISERIELAWKQPLQNWITRARLVMRQVTLYADEYYAIALHARQVLPGIPGGWMYDKDDAQYPRGIRNLTIDGGETWQPHYNDDHLFYTFGTPPAPPPPPPPPPDKWAILALEQTITATGYTIVVTTDNPCHLKLLWTWHPPWVHREESVKRGMRFLWEGYWCFVAWEEIDQEEEGDTLEHTFIWTDWENCQTKYFRFTGSTAEQESPSDSPIFHKHYFYEAPPPPPWLHKEEWTWFKVEPPDFTTIFTEPWSV